MEKITLLSQHLRESEHTVNCEDVGILAEKENNNLEQKFKKRVAIKQEKRYFLNKKEKREVISDIWSAIITQIEVD